MRCKECNVDLPENYTLCPLCNNPASDDEVKIKGITAVPYPLNAPDKEAEIKKVKTPFSIEKLKAYFNR